MRNRTVYDFMTSLCAPRRSILCSIAVLVLLTAGRSAAATADDAGPAASPPVRIERCEVVSRSFLNDPFNGFRQEYVTGVALRYVNERPQPAKRVEVAIRYEGSTRIITDRGSFAAGVPIMRSLPTFAGKLNGGAAAQCSVLKVTFANGEIWNAEDGLR